MTCENQTRETCSAVNNLFGGWITTVQVKKAELGSFPCKENRQISKNAKLLTATYSHKSKFSESTITRFIKTVKGIRLQKYRQLDIFTLAPKLSLNSFLDILFNHCYILRKLSTCVLDKRRTCIYFLLVIFFPILFHSLLANHYKPFDKVDENLLRKLISVMKEVF